MLELTSGPYKGCIVALPNNRVRVTNPRGYGQLEKDHQTLYRHSGNTPQNNTIVIWTGKQHLTTYTNGERKRNERKEKLSHQC